MPEQSTIQIIPPNVKNWCGSTVLEAHGCVLLEHFTGKRYSYRVFDMETGKGAYLCHKPKPIQESEREVMILKFLSAGEASVSGEDLYSDYCIDIPREERVSHENLTETLELIFSKLLPEYGYSLRTEQMELAKDILESLRCRKISLSEAGVGIGKTHAYLIAAAIIKRRRINDFWLRGYYPTMAYVNEMPMIIATSSIALQKAIVKDYIPEISKMLMQRGIIKTPLTCVIRKGKEHYICDQRLNQLWQQSTRDGIKTLLEQIVAEKRGIDLDEMSFLDAYTKRRINVTSRCGVHCVMKDSCRYMNFIKNAQSDKVDFQVCNHNYLLADVLHRTKNQKPLIPNYQAVIIDEAHKFLPAARSMYGVELSKRAFPRIINDIRSFTFTQGESTEELQENANILYDKINLLFHILADNVPNNYNDESERFKTKIDGSTVEILRDIRGIIDELMKQLKERHIIRKYKNLYYNTLCELENIWERLAVFENHEDLIYWLEKPDGLYSSDGIRFGETLLCAIPKNLDEMLYTDFWSKGVPVILTSGTLSASGDFTHVKLGMGLNKLKLYQIMESSRASPFNYRENVLIYVSNTVPFPNNKDIRYIEAVAKETERLIMAAHGHTAVLFTSYRVMELVFEILKKRGIPFPLFMMGRKDLNAIERFRQSGNGVLLAAGSMWEGIDLPGDILSMLIIVKLPFSVPDSISEFEQARFGSAAAYKNAVIIPEMIVKLMQGFGRLIRTEYDSGVVALLDFRVRTGKFYHGIVFNALPTCRFTEDILLIEPFLQEKKSLDYFKHNNYYLGESEWK